MVNTVLTASSGIGAVELVEQIPPVSPKIEVIKLIIQLAIGVVALLRLRKPKQQ
ncbi:hypothetical protein [Flavobacterium undicola]|uniref:hypothetical protein n=1 Tax=Flavobacterium undicola TaxID=1932779 RepID=UPI001377276A|nr:hypothetical protein [Flavobacterium undicola]MBA0883801.1 hypothetical protein [Flavobacterium undicola]